MTSGFHSYRTGAGWAVAAPDVVALGGSDTPMEVLAALWEAAGEGADSQDLIDTILGVGLRRLPAFGFVHRSGDVVHVLVRGEVQAEITDDDGADPEVLSAAGALTWVEQAVPATAAVVLRVTTPDPSGWLPVVGGIVRASAITIGSEACVDSVAALADAVTDLVDVPPDPSTSGREAGEAAGGPASAVGPAVPVEPVAVPIVEQALVEGPGADSPPDDVGPPVVPTADASAVPTDPNPVTTSEDGADDGSMTLVAPPEEDAGGDVAPQDAPGADIDDFDDLFGATRAPVPVEEAAVRPEADVEPAGSAPVSGGAPVTVADPQLPAYAPAAPPATFPAPEPVVSQPPAATGGLISSVPINPAAPVASPAPPTGSPPAGAQEDPALMTVSRARVTELRNGPSLGAAVVAGPPVHGVRCVQGHPNPPAATRCRVCDGTVAETDPVTMPRPVLGALAFSNGMRVTLDRSAIIGRSPRTERVSVSELPQLVVVPSPEADISRSHVEVRLEGWHVLVVDLDSTNGTVVTVPGQAPERIRPREGFPIIPGTVVSLADELAFTYVVEP